MRNNGLVLVLCCGLALTAAEKARDWQTGQVVESKAQLGPQVHTILAAGKNYLVTGSLGGDDDAWRAGATVRFAVEGKTMFVSIAGKEYRLNLLGETRSTAGATSGSAAGNGEAPRPVEARKTGVAPPQPAAAPSEVLGAAPTAAPAPAPDPALDNDSVVKMLLAGLKPDTIAQVIKTRPGKYVLTPDAIAGLKTAGVPQSVIAAMSAKMNPPR
jgi:hypothetical protein